MQSSTILYHLMKVRIKSTRKANEYDSQIWDSKSDKVTDRYFDSEFIGHATAADMLTHFNNGMALLNPSSLVQISMDDPNVNWKVYHNLFQESKGEELPDFLNIFSSSSSIVYWVLSMEDLKRVQKNLDGIFAIIYIVCG